MYFRYFVFISLWKMAWPSIWTNSNPNQPRMFCAKFGWNQHSSSGEEDENVKSLQTDGRRTTGDQKRPRSYPNPILDINSINSPTTTFLYSSIHTYCNWIFNSFPCILRSGFGWKFNSSRAWNKVSIYRLMLWFHKKFIQYKIHGINMH